MRNLVERWTNRKITCRSKAKQSKKAYLKAAQRIKIWLGNLLHLPGLWKMENKALKFLESSVKEEYCY